jgi:membrane associated rhomboid family serine protease
VRLLLLANAIAFVAVLLLQSILMVAAKGSGISLDFILGLSRPGVFQKFMIWQPLTYLFVHGWILHLVWNMFVLWIFGCDVERTWGTRRFLFFYFLTGVGAGLFILLLSGPETVTIGASGAVLGVLVAFAMLFPNRPITLLLFFVFPVTLKAKHLAIGIVVITFLSLIRQAEGDHVSHLGHFGGMALGYLYVRFSDTTRSRFDNLVGNLGGASRGRRPRGGKRRAPDRYSSEAVDAILDKIVVQGIDSLTEEERDVLKKASSRMR